MTETQLLGGRYALGETIGIGGMAEVFSGTDVRLGRDVAVKVLRADLARDPAFQARFRREAQSAASLNAPCIVSVYDTGEDNGVPYIVMEYVEGRTLRDILQTEGRLLPQRALEVAADICAALDVAHGAGIVHRDIKPGNVMLTPRGEVKVMDFGIARAVADTSSTMTQTAAVIGTAAYLSPEQARGEHVDARSDIYSTGCLLYELVTGTPPFTGDSPVAVAYQHVREPAVPPSDHDTSLTPEIDAIVMKALAKRVEDRYQSAAAMRADIERYLAGHPVRATAPPLPPDPQTTVVPAYANDPVTQSTITTQAVPPDDDDGGSRTGLFVLLGALLVALIVGAAFLLPSLFEDSPEQVQVPDLIGMTEAQARAAIGDAGLAVGQPEYVADPDVAKDKVVKQDPNRDTFVDPGATVTITVSTGKPMTSVPAVVGQDRSTARATLESANLVAAFVEKESDEPRDQVIETDPAAGEQVPEGTKITVYFSDGPEKVPDVVGMTENEAVQALKQAGFKAFVTTSNDTKEPKGTVINQNPEGGSEQSEGTSVTIVVSSFEEPSETPTPTPSDTPTVLPTDTPTATPSGVPPTP